MPHFFNLVQPPGVDGFHRVCAVLILKRSYIRLEQEVLLCEDHRILNLGSGDKQIEGGDQIRSPCWKSPGESHVRVCITIYTYVMLSNTGVRTSVTQTSKTKDDQDYFSMEEA